MQGTAADRVCVGNNTTASMFAS